MARPEPGPGIAERIEGSLRQFVAEATAAFGDDLRSVVLFGSAVDGSLRPTSDVNVLVVLRRFELARAERAGAAVALARAAIRLAPMFVLETELQVAARSFAVKFADLLRRRRVLHGDDPLAGIAVPRAARIDRLRQVALNVALRLRASLVDAATRDERLAPVIARAAGPLRAAALTLLELEGTAAATSKEAFGRIAGEIDAKRAERLLPEISRARESASVTPGAGAETVLLLVDVALAIGVRVERLDRGGAP